MIRHPRPGSPVRVHRAKTTAHRWPDHGQRGTVIAAARGPGPRNVAVRLEDGRAVVYPCGNLMPMPPSVPKV